MILSDILINRRLTDSEIETAIAKLFSVSKKDILIVDDFTEVEFDPSVRVLCERWIAGGDFPFVFSIYPQDSNLPSINIDRLVEYLCNTFGLQCLISDDDLNPFSMILVQNSNIRKRVVLNPIRFDEHEYVLLEQPLRDIFPNWSNDFITKNDSLYSEKMFDFVPKRESISNFGNITPWREDKLKT